MIEVAGQSYWAVIGSDVDRDGMFLEVQDTSGDLIAQVFYSDHDSSLTFSSFRADVPIPLVEWMVAHAKERLTPSN